MSCSLRIAFVSILLSFALATSAQVPITQPLDISGAEHPADVTVTITSRAGDTLLTVSGERLHDVGWMDRYLVPNATPKLDLEAGVLSPIQELRQSFSRDLWSATVRPSGKPAYPSELAWLATNRQGVRASDFGVVSDPSIDNGPALNWTALTASRLRPTGTIVRIELPAGDIGYTGPIILPDSVEWVGVGGTSLGPVLQDEFGLRYQPVLLNRTRGPPDSYTRLRVLDGHAFDSVASYPQASGAQPNPPSGTGLELARYSLRQEASAFFVASRAAWVRLADIEFDGNGEASLHQLEASSSFATETCLRNAPCASGIVAGNHGGLIVPEGPLKTAGRIVILDRVAVHDYAATGILGHFNARFVGNTVRAGNALYNHVLYAAEGEWDHLTIHGYAWTHWIGLGAGSGDSDVELAANDYTRAVVRNLVLTDLAPNPSGRTPSDAGDLRLGYGSLEILGLYANLRGGGPRYFGFARPYDRPEYDPSLNYVGELADIDGERNPLWDVIGDHRLTITDAAVVLPSGSNRFLTLRQPGPVFIDSLTVITPDPDAFRVATGSGGDLVIPRALTVLDDTPTHAPGPIAPPAADSVVVDPPDTGDAERIRQLEEQIRDLTHQLATERAALAQVRGELAITLTLLSDERALSLSRQIALDAALQQIATAEARIEDLSTALSDAQERARMAAEILTGD